MACYDDDNDGLDLGDTDPADMHPEPPAFLDLDDAE